MVVQKAIYKAVHEILNQLNKETKEARFKSEIY